MLSQRLNFIKSSNTKYFISLRNFSSKNEIKTVELAYDFHPSPVEVTSEPIIFLHGLFGSKANNRTVSR